MPVLSIQSAVAYGHVGNAVAVPALQALGQEVWRVDTVSFSNHPGHGRMTGGARPPSEVGAIVEGIIALGVMERCDAVLSGYLGDAGMAGPVMQAVAAAREFNSDAVYVLDPVIGDDGRIFVREGVLETIRDQLVPNADIVLPNPSELGWLTGGKAGTVPQIIAGARTMLRRGPSAVVVTGIEEAGEIAVYAIREEAVWRASSPRRARRFNGTGDLFAALFAGWYLTTRDVARALSATVAGLDLVTGETERLNVEELAIVPALLRLAACGQTAPAERID